MNDDLYLSDELKQYYMTDFEKLLTYKKSDFWDIDDGLINILVKINNSQNVQTIYEVVRISRTQNSVSYKIRTDSLGNAESPCLCLIERGSMPLSIKGDSSV